MGVKMNSLMPKKSEILQRFEIDKKTSFFSIKEMALLWIRYGLGWPERDFGVVGELCHVGAHFEDLDALIFMALSDFIGFFLRH